MAVTDRRPSPFEPPGGRPPDALGRRLHDLRISVTDRCNFRCVYCMPAEVYGKDFAFLPRALVLTFEEVERLGRGVGGGEGVTVSLDSLDPVVFAAMNGVDFPVSRVLEGIDAAREAGFAPIKINTVVRRDLNEASVLPMARWARAEGLILRFIEYMDVGHSNGWRMDDVVPAAEIVARVGARMALG